MKTIHQIIEITDELSCKIVDKIVFAVVKPFQILSKIMQGPKVEEPKNINDAIQQMSRMSSF